MAADAPLIPRLWEVPAKFRERLGANAGRQRVMSADKHLLLVLHDVPAPSDPKRKAALFWRAPEGSWKAARQDGKAQSLRAHVEAFLEVARKLETAVEEAKRAADYFAVLQHAGPLLRTTRNLHRVLQEARELCADDRDLLLARDLAIEAERTVDLLHGDAKNGLDYTIARQAEEQSRLADELNVQSLRLNRIAALFLPISALGAMLGMNLQHGLEQWNAPWAFWALTAIFLMLGLIVQALASARPRAR